MSQRLAIFSIASLLLAGAGAASAESADAGSMILGQIVAPPIGYVEFCEQRPGDCPEAGAQGVRFDSAFWTLAFHSPRSSRLKVGPPSSVRVARMARSVYSYPGPFADAELSPTPTAAGAKVALSPVMWADLNRANDMVNRRIISTPDRANYGVDDRWALPLAEGHRAGDCEDYVLEKRRALIRMGVPANVLSIALVRTRWNENHAVLLVETDHGALVLDSLSPRIAHWSQVDYGWIMRQSPTDPAQWVEVKDAAPRSQG
jgi:predicted transglutaminase-like cysteine proteinase